MYLTVSIVSEKKTGPIILVTLKTNHTPTSVSCNARCVVVWDYLPTGAFYSEYLLDCLSNHICKLTQQNIDFTTTQCFTAHATKPYCRNIVRLLELLNNCKYDFKRSNFVVACKDDFDTPVSLENCLMGFRGHTSESMLMPSNVSYERTCVRSHFFCNKEAVRNVHTSR